MPSRPLRPCNHPGCRKLVQSGYCEDHKKDIKQYDRFRGTAAERGYDNKWQVYRKSYLQVHPLCIECMKEKRIEPATVIDHIIPHKGNMVLFWDHNNHQSLCKRHHDIKTAKEDGGFGNTHRG
jgi:5-methylcytosine-specific restriction protein A